MRVIRFGTGREPVISARWRLRERSFYNGRNAVTASSVRPLCYAPTSLSLVVRRSETSRNVPGKGELSQYGWCELCGVSVTEAVVLWLMDNESTRFSLSAMSSPVAASSDTLWSIADLEISLQALSWYEREPTANYLADDPSRLCFEDVPALGFVVENADGLCHLSGLPVQNCQLESVLLNDTRILSSFF